MSILWRSCVWTSLIGIVGCLNVAGQDRQYEGATRRGGDRVASPDPRNASLIQPGLSYSWSFPAVSTSTLFTGDWAYSFNVGANVTGFRVEVTPTSPSNADMDVFVRKGLDPTVGTSGVVSDYQNAYDSTGPVTLSVNAATGSFLSQGDYRIALAVWLPLNQPVSGTVRLTIIEGATCSYTLTSSLGTGNRIQVSSAWTTGQISVSTQAGCAWTASDNADWILLTPTSGSGPGTITVSISDNTGTSQREGTVTIGGSSITFVQSPPDTDPPLGSKFITHIAAGAEWTTTIYLTNLNLTSSESYSLVFYQPNGSKWTLSLNNATASQKLNGILAPGQTAAFKTTTAAELKVGWAALVGGTNVTGYAVFRSTGSTGSIQEAAVPIISQTQKKYVMQYFANSESDSGIALVNPTTLPVRIAITFRTMSGQSSGSHYIDLPALGHTAVSALATFPAQALANLEGVMTLTANSGFAVLGLRFNVKSSSFTSFEPFYLFGTAR